MIVPKGTADEGLFGRTLDLAKDYARLNGMSEEEAFTFVSETVGQEIERLAPFMAATTLNEGPASFEALSHRIASDALDNIRAILITAPTGRLN